MREILTKSDFNEIILQDKAILLFYHDWSNYSSVHGIQNLKETENFFQKQKKHPEINFWTANVSSSKSPANFLLDWVKVKSDLLNWIETGNPSIIWLRFGTILDYKFSAYILKTEGIIETTKQLFN